MGLRAIGSRLLLAQLFQAELDQVAAGLRQAPFFYKGQLYDLSFDIALDGRLNNCFRFGLSSSFHNGMDNIPIGLLCQ